MSSNTRSSFTGLGPFQDMFSAYASSFPAGPQGIDTFFRNMARCQLEMQGLMSRRAQAYMEFPARGAQCRSPQELVQEQTRFWQMAFEQYSECSRKMFGSWAQLMQMPVPGADRTDGQSPLSRDYLSFPEARPGNGAVAPQGTSRRVA